MCGKNIIFVLVLFLKCADFTGCWKISGKLDTTDILYTFDNLGIKQCAKKCLTFSNCESIIYDKSMFSCQLTRDNMQMAPLLDEPTFLYSEREDMRKYFADVCGELYCSVDSYYVNLHNEKKKCVSLADCNEFLNWSSNNICKQRVTSTGIDCHITYGMLDSIASAWCPYSTADLINEFFEIKFIGPYILKAVITQGRSDTDQWVTKYRVGVYNNLVWTYVNEGFIANYDRNTPVTNRIPGTVVTNIIRINPLEYYGYPALRLDFIGCLQN